jgi:condensin complex subunit 2
MFYGEDDSRDGESHDGPAYDFVDDNRDDANFFSADDFQVDELQNIRRVERVEVAHAVVSKKVDVKRLKSSLWSELDSKLSNLATVDDCFSTDESKTAEIKPVSFRDTVKDLSASQSQESVSFAFYFICVLHLANENSLVLDNSDYGLSDFFISRS